MQAQISREGQDESEVIVVHLSGRVDVETAEPFRETCLKRLNGRRVVFDFRELSFVGSSGILPFLEALQNFAVSNETANGQERKANFKFSGVGVEFQRVFAATPLQVIDMYENFAQAALSFTRPIAPIFTGAVQAAPLVERPEVAGSFGFLSFHEEPESSGEGSDIDEESD